ASTNEWSDALEYVAISDVGMRRASNQDAHAEVIAPDAEHWIRRGHVFVVCDGMGAHAAGELASKMAVDGIPHTYLKLADRPAPDALRKSIQETNHQIYSRGQANADFHGMGTTASTLVLLPHGALVAHVGDSRVYRLRGKRLEQLTFDHSLVWEMSAAGQVPKDSIPPFVPKNVITRSLGPHPNVQVDLEGPYPLEIGDTFLLCSDGLTGQVNDEEIGAILQSLPPKEAAQVLVDLANLRGGPDNVTVVVIRVQQPLLTAASGYQIEPLVLNGDVESQPENDAAVKNLSVNLWVAAVVSLVIAMGLGIAQLQVGAFAALVVAIALGLIGWLQRISPTERRPQFLSPDARIGRGPHATVDCEPDEKLVQELLSIVEQLRDAAVEEQWSIAWHEYTACITRGKDAAERKDYGNAVREYASALRLMMNQLRSQRAKRSNRGDSVI
ncbi:MAG: serine/threonine-protein phosphatase, partial [Pirellulales bacterium]|nr:serine/threonine-protein phosphatase [Pirellulales bacterium]